MIQQIMGTLQTEPPGRTAEPNRRAEPPGMTKIHALGGRLLAEKVA
jgi:hypothetical protein